jgi:hypothetical protein
MQDIIRANYEMTAEECDLYVKLFQKAESDQRFYLLKIREEKGWKAKGFESFEDFGKETLGLEVPRLYQLAKAGEVHLSLPDYTNGINIPERQLRPLAPLNDEERVKVWNEATAKAEADQKKLTAKMVQEAVDRLTAEKAKLQANLDLVFQEKEAFRQQDNARRKALKEQEELTKTAQTEAATLRRTISAEAEKLASAKLMEMKGSLESLELDKIELKQKLAQIKKDQAAAIETGTKHALQSQQDEINRREAQLQSIEKKIEIQHARMLRIDEQDRVYAHFETAIKKIKASMNALSLDLMDAFDPELAVFLPSAFQKDIERIALELDQGAGGVRRLLNQTEIRHLEVSTNE